MSLLRIKRGKSIQIKLISRHLFVFSRNSVCTVDSSMSIIVKLIGCRYTFELIESTIRFKVMLFCINSIINFFYFLRDSYNSFVKNNFRIWLCVTLWKWKLNFILNFLAMPGLNFVYFWKPFFDIINLEKISDQKNRYSFTILLTILFANIFIGSFRFGAARKAIFTFFLLKSNLIQERK